MGYKTKTLTVKKQPSLLYDLDNAQVALKRMIDLLLEKIKGEAQDELNEEKKDGVIR